MNINQLRQFSCVARHKSMTKAAGELFISQQALSKTIQLMQKEMGGELFVRSSRGLQLTELGGKLLTIADSLLPRYDSCMEMIARLSERKGSTLTICCEQDYFQYAIPPALLREGGLVFRSAEACAEELLSGSADLGLCTRGEEMEGLEYIPLVSEPLQFLMSRRHPLAEKSYLTLEDLREVPQNLPGTRSPLISRYIQACMEQGFYPRFTLESRDYSALLRSLEGSERVQLCAGFVYSEELREKLALLPLRHETLRMDLGFLVRKGSSNPRARQFIRAVQDAYTK